MRLSDPTKVYGAVTLFCLTFFVAGAVAFKFFAGVLSGGMRMVFFSVLVVGAVAMAVFAGLWFHARARAKALPRGRALDARPEDVSPPPGVPAGPVSAADPAHGAPAASYSWKNDVEIWRDEWKRWRERIAKFSWVLEEDAAMPDEVRGTGRAFTAMRLGIARLQGGTAEETVMTAVSPAPGELYGGLEKGVAAVIAGQGERIRGITEEAIHPIVEQKRRLDDYLLEARWHLGYLAGLKARLQHLQSHAGLVGKVARVEAEAEALAKRAAALAEASGASGLAPLLERLPPVVDALEVVAYRLSMRDYYRQHAGFAALRRRLEADVIPMLAGAPEDEAARHYERALRELLAQMDLRLQRALEDVRHPGESLAGAGDLELRVERLWVRADRLRKGDRNYLVEQARPSVQEHLRPLVDTLIRDFLSPLLQEASGSRGDSLLARVAAVVKGVLAETIALELIEPREGDRINEDAHEEVDVRVPGPGQAADTVASVVDPGYRWSGELIARARVRSYR